MEISVNKHFDRILSDGNFVFINMQLFGLNAEGTEENEWDKVAVEARKTISDLERVGRQCSEVQHEASEQRDANDFIICDQILPKLRDLDNAERARKYLLWIRKINRLRYNDYYVG